MPQNHPRINREGIEPAHPLFLPDVVISYTDTAAPVEPILIDPFQLHARPDRPNVFDLQAILSFFRRASPFAILGLAFFCTYLVAMTLHGMSL